MDNKEGTESDSYLEIVFPDPESSLTWTVSPITEIVGECLVVLDSNVLLLPYGVMPQSLNELKSKLTQLKNENRLWIAAHSAREFLNRRPNRISNIYKQISDIKSQSVIPGVAKIPLIEESENYKRALEVEVELKSKLREYQKFLTNCLDEIRSWVWSDPLTDFYRDLFANTQFLNISIKPTELEKEGLRRLSLKVPPGYKDAAKDSNSLGDVKIWLSILEAGNRQQKDCIFVSNDTKTDWWHQSDSSEIFPRSELIDEYRRASGGKSFHLATLSSFLSLSGASTATVDDVREEEASWSLGRSMTAHEYALSLLAEENSLEHLMEQEFLSTPREIDRSEVSPNLTISHARRAWVQIKNRLRGSSERIDNILESAYPLFTRGTIIFLHVENRETSEALDDISWKYLIEFALENELGYPVKIRTPQSRSTR